jgi:hypothetical protein
MMDKIILMEGAALQIGKAINYPIPDPPTIISLQMCSPYRPTGQAKNSPLFLVNKFIMALVRRISLLQYFNTDQLLEADYDTLKQLADSLVITKNTLYQYNDSRLAKRNNQHKQGRGWLGRLDIDLSEHQALWPYLYLGQWLHVGKNASMGFGRYELISLD